MLVEDLQRCRRLVAGMRGLVLASSVKQQVLADLVNVAHSSGEPECNKFGHESPRCRYRRCVACQ